MTQPVQAPRWTTTPPRHLPVVRVRRREPDARGAQRDRLPAAGGSWCQVLGLSGQVDGPQRLRVGQQVAQVLQRQLNVAAARDRRAAPLRMIGRRSGQGPCLDRDVRWGGLGMPRAHWRPRPSARHACGWWGACRRVPGRS
jgi:hypothetical protein